MDVKNVKPAVRKKVGLKTENTDEDIWDFAGAANQEVRREKAEEHWLAVQNLSLDQWSNIKLISNKSPPHTPLMHDILKNVYTCGNQPRGKSPFKYYENLQISETPWGCQNS